MKTKLFSIIAVVAIIAIAIIALPLAGCGSNDTTPETFTVSFNANGGNPTPPDQTVEKGKTVTEPTAPTKTLFDFIGWFKEEVLTNQWNFATDKVNGNMTLWAKWSDDNVVKERSTTITLFEGKTATVTGEFDKAGLASAAKNIEDAIKANFDELLDYPQYIEILKTKYNKCEFIIVEKTSDYAKWKTNGDGKTIYLNFNILDQSTIGGLIDAAMTSMAVNKTETQ